MVRDTGFEPVTPTVSRVGSKEDCHTRNVTPQKARFINPHRLFHGVWLPQWLEERPEVSEKAKKLYAYLTYFAGGKGCAWPSFKHLGEKASLLAPVRDPACSGAFRASAHYRNKR